MKFIKIVLLSLFSIMLGNVFAQTFPVYDSTQVAQSLTGTRDIRFNTQFHKNSGALQTLKGVSMGTFYKALKGKLVSEGLVSGGGQIDSIQIYHDSILIAYTGGIVTDRDTIRLTASISALGGDLSGTIGSASVIDNSHNHNSSTITTDIVSSVDGVSNDGGNIDLIGTGVLTITPNDGVNTITLNVPTPDTTFSFGDLSGGINSGLVRGLRGKAISAVAPLNGQAYIYNSGTLTWVAQTLASQDTTLSGDVTGGINSTVVGDNSHTHNASTITTDIVSSINSVYNDGGNINIVSANALLGVSASDVSNAITLTAVTPDTTLSGDVSGGLNSTVVADNSHNHDATTITTNIVSSIGGVINDGGNIGLVGDSYITVTPNNTTDTITLSLNTSALTRPYKVYTALLTQTGTSDPVASVVENTLGGTVVWTYSVTGVYFATLASAFANGRTTVQVNYGYHTGLANIIEGYPSSTSVVRVQTRKSSDGALSEMEGSNVFIEIRVYNAL